MLLEQALERFLRQQARLFFGQHGKLRVELELVKVLPDQFEAKAVERAEVRRLEEGHLLAPMGIVRGRS